MLILDQLSAATDGVAGRAALDLMARLPLPFVKYTTDSEHQMPYHAGFL